MFYDRSQIATFALLLLSGFLFDDSAHAQLGLGGPGGVLRNPFGGSSGSAQESSQQESPQQVSTELGGLSQKFAASFQAMLMAESFTAKAMGLKADSEQLEKIADYYGKGNVDYTQVPRDVDVSDRAQSAIDANMAEAKTVDAAAKAQLATAVPYYATGTVNAVALPGEYAAWTNRAQAGVANLKSNPVAAASNAGLINQVPKVAQLTTQLPGLVQKWTTVTKNFLTFSKKHDVNTGDLAAKVGTL